MSDQRAYDNYRGYVWHIEKDGVYVWYKSGGFKNLGESQYARNGKLPTSIDRVVTTATTLEEAEKQLDRKLTKKPKEKEVYNPNQGRLPL